MKQQMFKVSKESNININNTQHLTNSTINFVFKINRYHIIKNKQYIYII